jgi:proton glutamate symport protein
MCIIPIVFTAITSSLSRLLQNKMAGSVIKRIVIIFCLGGFLACFLALTVGYTFKPGVLKTEAASALGEQLKNVDKSTPASAPAAPPSLIDFIKNIVPKNIFEAVSKGNILALTFFSVLFGITLGFLPKTSANQITVLLNSLYEIFLKLVEGVMYLLPFGLFFLVSSQIAHTGFSLLKSLFLLIILIYGLCILLIIFYTFLIKFRLKISFFKVVVSLRESILIALSTSSSFASIPATLTSLNKNLHVDRNFANLVLPMGISINPQGSIIYTAMSIMFFTQMFNISLSLEGYLIAFVGSILMGISTVGVPGAVTALSAIFLPLGIPAEVAIAILLAIDPIVDPILTLTTVYANCTATVLGKINQNDNSNSNK